jgi:peptidoglycan/LPS O-acetylase OafA/YrhL
MSKDLRVDIQGLRSIAVILVIFNHAAVPGFRGGFLGVDIFFVISGFVITRVLHRQPPREVVRNLANFYARRIRRIVPAATIVLCATVLIAWGVLGKAMDPALLTDVRWASMFSANIRLNSTGIDYFVPGLFPSLVTHFWSLGVEEQFYAIFPILVFSLTWLTPRRGRTPALFLLTTLAVGASAWWSAYETPRSHIHAFYLPFSRFWELGLGALAALVTPWCAQRFGKTRGWLSLAAVVALVLSIAQLTNGADLPGVLAWWPCGATAVLLVFGEGASNLVSAVLRWRPLTLVGDISYSLYLWHYLWIMLPLQLVNPPVGWWVKPAEILGAFACATASYVVVENPIRRSKRLDRDPLAVLLLLGVCVLAVWNVSWLASHALHLG